MLGRGLQVFEKQRVSRCLLVFVKAPKAMLLEDWAVSCTSREGGSSRSLSPSLQQEPCISD